MAKSQKNVCQEIVFRIIQNYIMEPKTTERTNNGTVNISIPSLLYKFKRVLTCLKTFCKYYVTPMQLNRNRLPAYMVSTKRSKFKFYWRSTVKSLI